MKIITTDGNGAVAHVSYAFSQIAFIYPITPSSPMAEQADEWSASKKENLFGEVPTVMQMQSEAGAAGALHGALTCGALTTTYTCSQGLLLMLPVMYKIAGELLPTVFHVSARAISTHALSIFGDHQDVMACRQTGFAMIASSSVQEAADMALIAHLGTLKGQIPFLHFFDGFRTSHEVNKIEILDYEEMKALLDNEDVTAFQRRGLTPERPIQRGTAQNPDVYFQNRERANEYYNAIPQTVQGLMDKLATVTGRQYKLFDYFGSPHAEHVAVMMGSGCATMQETVEQMNKEGFSVGVINVRLYRPFNIDAFCDALPPSVKTITVLDRTKEQGCVGEPLYLDVCAALKEKGRGQVCVYGGRYGLGGKDFTPSDCYTVFQNALSKTPKLHFTVGICDDITHTSLDTTPYFLNKDYAECIFYGLGSDGTVGANKNTLKVVGNHTNLFVQGYFCYDSRKSGGVTISHLRFGKTPINAPYLIKQASFVACHNPSYLERYDMLSSCREGGVFLLNCPWTTLPQLEENLPAKVKRQIAEKHLSLFVIDGTSLAREVGLKGKTSTVMQAAFFYLNQSILPYEQAKQALFEEITRKFSKKGDSMVAMNKLAIEKAESGIRQIDYPSSWKNTQEDNRIQAVAKDEYFRRCISPILHLEGDSLPVSAFQADGSVPTGTSKLEKHGAPLSLPKWIPQNCIQCNQCAFVCPHACIRPFLLHAKTEAPQDFVTIPAIGATEGKLRLQVSPHDCMGCGVCANTCPAKQKALVMTPTKEILEKEAVNWEYAQTTPTLDAPFKRNTVKGSQFHPPLFEFSYACAGCGETAYIKLLTQLFGERMLIANATGCSSIYGGSSPTCPYTTDKNGRGPAWASSLFEDNAEFGLDMRLAQELSKENATRSVWCIGGDGWAYDIGYGGLDHLLASGKNVNILVLDSEVYSNTGGQVSKATPMGATARFAVSGKKSTKKNLGLMAMAYKNVYVAQVSMGANMQQLINALIEAESYDGPSLILAYSPCIAHGFDMSKSVEEERRAVACGYWPLYRFNPTMPHPFTLDSKAPTLEFQEFLSGENRFATLQKSNPALAEKLFQEAQEENQRLFAFYQKLSTLFE